MKKIVIGDMELQTEGIIMGAVVATGLGLIGLSIKNLLDARKLKYVCQQPVEDDLEFEEYKEMKIQKLKKKRDAKLRRGIIGTVVGSFATAVGIAAFTPLRKYVVNDDFTLRADKVEKIDGVVSSVKELSGAIQDNIQDKVQTVRDIDFKGKVQTVKDIDIKDNFQNVKESVQNITALIARVRRIKCLSEKLEARLQDILEKIA